MKRILAIMLLLSACSAMAIERVTVTLVVTNGTTNGQTFTLNGATRTFTNLVVTPAVQVLTNSTAAGSKTNLFNQIGLNPFSQVNLINLGATNFSLAGASGKAMVASVSAGWASFSYSTQTVGGAIGVRVPITVEPNATQQTNIASLLVAGMSALSTNSFGDGVTAVSNQVSLANAQTISGAKTFTGTVIISNATSIFYLGSVSNAVSISGNVSFVTNGVFQSPIMVSPTLTNGANYGNAFSSPGTAANSEQFGTAAAATGSSSTAVGKDSIAGSGAAASAYGNAAVASGTSATAIGAATLANSTSASAFGNLASAVHASATAIGASATSTRTNQIRLGTATEYVSIPGNLKVEGNITNAHFAGTNTFDAGSDVSFGRFAITSLANGNNAGVVVGTNVFIEVSGPSAAFTINGMANGRDGKIIYVVNQTGFDMTVAHQSGVDATAANRIITMTGADRTTTGNGAATFIYSGAASRWLCIAFDP